MAPLQEFRNRVDELIRRICKRAHDSGIGLHLTWGEIKAVKIMEALAPGMDLPGNVCDSVRAWR